MMSGAKMKSNSGAGKRFRVTASGKIKRKRNNLQHILTTHPRKVKRRYRKKTLVVPAEEGKMRKLMPYAF
jgi:large subunit ribosomal protein L35